jgi:uncharacterized protein (TIGR02646 family)
VQVYLKKRQLAVKQRRARSTLDIEREWKAARQSKPMRTILKTLQQMMGVRERCMYCIDSHGSDIEHFRPKARYAARAFLWSNMLLCCAECGRLKGSQFPVVDRRPMLIDPTTEDPWQHLDFDPDTGNLTARFDLRANDWSAKGATTVAVLQLDRREAMAAGYLGTYRRLAGVLHDSLALLGVGATTVPAMLAALDAVDDHGLLPWVFTGTGQTFAPFSELRQRYPRIWAECVAAMGPAH